MISKPTIVAINGGRYLVGASVASEQSIWVWHIHRVGIDQPQTGQCHTQRDIEAKT
jgi:hypothetical protein